MIKTEHFFKYFSLYALLISTKAIICAPAKNLTKTMTTTPTLVLTPSPSNTSNKAAVTTKSSLPISNKPVQKSSPSSSANTSSDESTRTSAPVVVTKPSTLPSTTAPVSTKTASSASNQTTPATTKPSTSTTTTVAKTMPTTTTTKPVLSTAASASTTSSASATSINPLASLQTGNTYSFANITLTELQDPTGIFIYSGTFFTSNITDYFVVMPSFVYTNALTITDTTPYPSYNPSTPVLLMPGQQITTSYTVPTAPSVSSSTPATTSPQTQTCTYAISLISGTCYSFQGSFTQSKTGSGSGSTTTPAKNFINPNVLTNISSTSLASQNGPIENFFTTYAPYPNFSGRLSTPLANNIANAIAAVNGISPTNNISTTTSVSSANPTSAESNNALAIPTSLSPALSIPQLFTALQPKTSTISKPITYQLANITLTELLDPSGIYVYAGTLGGSSAQTYGSPTIDYFVFTTAYHFGQLNNTGSYPMYNYEKPIQPLVFPGQQLTQAYTVPGPSTASTTVDGFAVAASTATITQPVTHAISLVTGNCYQLMNRNSPYIGTPVISSSLGNPTINLAPLMQVITTPTKSSSSTTTTASAPATPNIQIIQNMYQNYAPYDNFTGPLNNVLTGFITAALIAEEKEIEEEEEEETPTLTPTIITPATTTSSSVAPITQQTSITSQPTTTTQTNTLPENFGDETESENFGAGQDFGNSEPFGATTNSGFSSSSPFGQSSLSTGSSFSSGSSFSTPATNYSSGSSFSQSSFNDPNGSSFNSSYSSGSYSSGFSSGQSSGGSSNSFSQPQESLLKENASETNQTEPSITPPKVFKNIQQGSGTPLPFAE